MTGDWARKAHRKLLEQGIDACSTYVEDLPTDPATKRALLAKCVDDWCGQDACCKKSAEQCCDEMTNGDGENMP